MPETEGWREFEKLISRIEKMLAPFGAEVKSPDRIRDRVTGRLREVDASIRHVVGSVPILITIECRDRKGRQGVPWLEQVRTKKESIGAAQTIVVSRSGFTPEALMFAQAHGLIVRSIQEVDDEFILRCVGGLQIACHRVAWKDVSASIKFRREPQDDGHGELGLDANVLDRLSQNQAFAADEDGGEITIGELFQETCDLQQELLRDHLRDRTEIRAGISASLAPGEVYTLTNRGKRFIDSITFEATFYTKVTPLPPLTPISYVDQSGKKITSFSQTHDPVTGFGVTIQFDWDDDGQRIA
ncbi:restriction endonuclease [Ensifer sp. ENS02]|uniref:restriction endonuclease n=1 Tax=Ensifer sp. ENS02 TaxID=2769290 RepID=UPI00177BAEAE|nr:restriction endonuclease [Ensifer sp. ENS02]MBD9524676.1 restriction endonuclease [Ensifer sp. ENS02]